jgi:hypothetical protein
MEGVIGMENSKEWLTTGPEASYDPPPLIGIQFISLNSTPGLELIGEIIRVVDSIATVKDPIVLGRDPKNVTKFNLFRLEQMNPVVGDEIQIPLASILFFCKPKDQFGRNYIAARSGLITSSVLPNGANPR